MKVTKESQVKLKNQKLKNDFFFFQFLRIRWLRLDRDQWRGDEESSIFDSIFDLRFPFSRFSGQNFLQSFYFIFI